MKRILLFEPEPIITLDLKSMLNRYLVESVKKITDVNTKLQTAFFDLLIIHLQNTEQEIKEIGIIKKHTNSPVIILDPLEGRYYPYKDTFIKIPINKAEFLEAVEKNLKDVPSGKLRIQPANITVNTISIKMNNEAPV